MIEQCQEELLRKKNSIIQKLQSTRIAILEMINTDPRLWDTDCIQFDLNSQATLLLKADVFVQDPVQRARNRELEEKEAIRKAKEEQDQAKLTKLMQIFVKIYEQSRTITLDVKLSDTIKNLKAMIHDKEGIQPNKQCLNFNGKPLRDELTLYDYSINKERTIELVRRLPDSFRDKFQTTVVNCLFSGTDSVDRDKLWGEYNVQ